MKSQKLALLVWGVSIAFVAGPEAGEVAVTGVCVTNEVVLSDFLKVRGLELISKGKEVTLKLPEAKSRSGRSWTQIRILDKKVEQAIIDAIRTQRTSAAPKKKPSYKIADWINIGEGESSWEGPGELKIVAWVTFDDTVSVKCKLLETRRGLMVSWPVQPTSDNGLIPIVSVTDEGLRKEIEKAIVDKYKRHEP